MERFPPDNFLGKASAEFPGIGEEFMPSLNEGSFLLMPTSMPHTGIAQNLDYIEALDKRLAAIPEVETAIGNGDASTQPSTLLRHKCLKIR